MLTYVVRCRNDSIFMIDEPHIYLHSDLQRQLVSVLRDLGPDILVATHSTEIVAESEPGELLTINKRSKSAKRINDPGELQKTFALLGSNLNPILTQSAKTKKVLFVEGKDFQILSAFARRLRRQQVANRSDFAVIPVEGFNPQKVRDLSEGIELALGARISKGVIFDRDYRSSEEVRDLTNRLSKICSFVHINSRKEIENYLLESGPIERALRIRIMDRATRGEGNGDIEVDVASLLSDVTERLKNDIQGQYLAKREPHEKSKNPGHDPATINSRLLEEFDKLWGDLSQRMAMVPGKRVLGLMNMHFQNHYKVTLSANTIISSFTIDDVPPEMKQLIENLDRFRNEGGADDDG